MGVSYDLPEGVRPLLAHDAKLHEGTLTSEGGTTPCAMVHLDDHTEGRWALVLTPDQAALLAVWLADWVLAKGDA